MSYSTIARAALDGDLMQRCVAAAAAEGHPNPEFFVRSKMWAIASDVSVSGPYEFAANNRIDRPGLYDDVVSDQVILAVVQPLVAADNIATPA